MDTVSTATRTTLSLAPMFSDRQVEIMNLLWERGSATSREAWEAMDEEPTYRSILATFQSLEETGYVRHDSEPDGNAVRFRPVLTREEAEREVIDHVLRRLFRQYPETMLDALLPEARVDRPASEDTLPPRDRSGHHLDSAC